MTQRYRITVEGKEYEVFVETLGESGKPVVVPAPRSQPTPTSIEHVSTAPMGAGDLEVRSPLAGKLTKVLVSKGQAVKEGEQVAVLEAMKVYNHVFAPRGGQVKNIVAAEGSSLKEGALILSLE
ncbi:MAG: acetyl-CoA carboxylase biotin carboxyl carrier protein subunit [Elusimicrobia bacterium]|nr:acetyl-CoA carboxylase biotin carboxyl carrier protein subunit [Elusimicrobiota bacterium]